MSGVMHHPTRDILTEELFAPVAVRAYTSLVEPGLIPLLRSAEVPATERMVASRQAEFATARACARAAMADLGIDDAVPKREGGSPQWPAGLAGSISHTRGFCLAVASGAGHLIGVDVEEIARMSQGVERRILVDDERDQLHGLSHDERQRRVATIFAAKEAFYKAHYELDARYLGFDVIAVRVDGDELFFEASSGDVDAAVVEGTTGRARVYQGRVIAGISINPVGLAAALRSQA